MLVRLAYALGVTLDYLLIDRINSEDNFFVKSVAMRMNSMPQMEQAYILKVVEIYFEHHTSGIMERNETINERKTPKKHLSALNT